MKKFEDLTELEKEIIANLVDGIMVKNNLKEIEELSKIEKLTSEDTLKEILSEIKLLKTKKAEEEAIKEDKVCACGVCI